MDDGAEQHLLTGRDNLACIRLEGCSDLKGIRLEPVHLSVRIGGVAAGARDRVDDGVDGTHLEDGAAGASDGSGCSASSVHQLVNVLGIVVVAAPRCHPQVARGVPVDVPLDVRT